MRDPPKIGPGNFIKVVFLVNGQRRVYYGTYQGIYGRFLRLKTRKKGTVEIPQKSVIKVLLKKPFIPTIHDKAKFVFSACKLCGKRFLHRFGKRTYCSRKCFNMASRSGSKQ